MDLEGKEVRLIENFASWQGEGPDSGRNMIILRFKTCNLKCSWCDTAVKMRITEESPHRLIDIQKNIIEKRSGLLITGGEPTVSRHFDECLSLINELDYPIANVESNGFKLKELVEKSDPTKNVRFIYSPKIFNFIDLTNAIKRTEDLLKYDNVLIKVVYEITEYTEFIEQYLSWLNLKQTYKNSERVWLMPKGSTRKELLNNSGVVFDACERYKFNFSTRSHIMFNFI